MLLLFSLLSFCSFRCLLALRLVTQVHPRFIQVPSWVLAMPRACRSTGDSKACPSLSEHSLLCFTTSHYISLDLTARGYRTNISGIYGIWATLGNISQHARHSLLMFLESSCTCQKWNLSNWFKLVKSSLSRFLFFLMFSPWPGFECQLSQSLWIDRSSLRNWKACKLD